MNQWHVLACCPECLTAFNAEAGNRTGRAWVTCPDCGHEFWGLVVPKCPETTFPIERITLKGEKK